MDCLTLKKSNCKNCYKCIRHCPVKSIRFSGNQAYIIGNECILCGQCFVVCPQDAKQIVDETEKVKVLLHGNEPVYVSLAPSFIANYRGIGIDAMRAALQQLPWTNAQLSAILRQSESTQAMPEAPGGYMTGRYIISAATTVINNGLLPRDTLMDYTKNINDEVSAMRRKLGLTGEGA